MTMFSYHLLVGRGIFVSLGPFFKLLPKTLPGVEENDDLLKGFTSRSVTGLRVENGGGADRYISVQSKNTL